jgi:hypothetical protein
VEGIYFTHLLRPYVNPSHKMIVLPKRHISLITCKGLTKESACNFYTTTYRLILYDYFVKMHIKIAFTFVCGNLACYIFMWPVYP